MSATPPFGPAYDEQPEDGRRPGPGQWRPRADGPREAQGEPGRYQSGPRRPEGPQAGRGGQPQAGGPQGGQRPMPQAGRPSQDPRGGVPRAGGPAAGRGPGPYQPPQHSPQSFEPQPGSYESRRAQQSGPVTGSTPRTDPRQPAPRRDTGSQPRTAGDPRFEPQPQGAQPAGQEPPALRDQPFEEAAFADEARGEWAGGGETTTIGRLGYMPKEPRRRSDFQKVRSRARKSSPIPKILIGVVVLALVGGGVWWFMNRDEGEQGGGQADSGLTYEGSEEPCALVDAGPLESAVNGTEPETVANAEGKSGGWEQGCSLTYGEPDRAAALLQVEGTAYESDAKASVNFELGTNDIGESGEAWTVVDPAPAVGDRSAAVARIVTDGTSNFNLHVQDDNAYVVVRLSVSKDAALDEQALTDMATAIANSYLENWRDAS